MPRPDRVRVTSIAERKYISVCHINSVVPLPFPPAVVP